MGSRAAATFSAPIVPSPGHAIEAQISALKARFPDASATALRGLSEAGFSDDGSARIAGSESGAAALAELYDDKHLSALGTIGFSDGDIVAIAASGNGEETIQQVLQAYRARASATENGAGKLLNNSKIGDDTAIPGIRNAVGTPALAKMCKFAERKQWGELQVIGGNFARPDLEPNDSIRTQMRPRHRPLPRLPSTEQNGERGCLYGKAPGSSSDSIGGLAGASEFRACRQPVVQAVPIIVELARPARLVAA